MNFLSKTLFTIAFSFAIPVLASEVLHKFMVRGWPDEHLFKKVIGEYLDRAQAGGREVRAFGEIVDLLMADDELAATIRVEQLWTECCEERKLTLLCAYSRKRLPEDSRAAEAICDEHDWMLDGHRRVDPTLPPLFAQTLLPRGPKSAAGWSIAGTQHSETGTRWMLRPLVR